MSSRRESGQVPQGHGHFPEGGLGKGAQRAAGLGGRGALQPRTLAASLRHRDPLPTRGRHGAASPGIAQQVSSETPGGRARQCGWDAASGHLPFVGLMQRFQARLSPEGLEEARSSLHCHSAPAPSSRKPLSPGQRPPTHRSSPQAPTAGGYCVGIASRTECKKGAGEMDIGTAPSGGKCRPRSPGNRG